MIDFNDEKQIEDLRKAGVSSQGQVIKDFLETALQNAKSLKIDLKTDNEKVGQAYRSKMYLVENLEGIIDFIYNPE